jgi:hypothetical protein
VVEVVVERLRQHQRRMLRQCGHACIAGRVAWLGQQNVERDAAGAVAREQDFGHVGDARARPRPRAKPLQASFVDVHHQHARIRRIGGVQAHEGVAQQLVAKRRRGRPGVPLQENGKRQRTQGDDGTCHGRR